MVFGRSRTQEERRQHRMFRRRWRRDGLLRAIIELAIYRFLRAVIIAGSIIFVLAVCVVAAIFLG
jgi:hypothetical protein